MQRARVEDQQQGTTLSSPATRKDRPIKALDSQLAAALHGPGDPSTPSGRVLSLHEWYMGALCHLSFFYVREQSLRAGQTPHAPAAWLQLVLSLQRPCFLVLKLACQVKA